MSKLVRTGESAQLSKKLKVDLDTRANPRRDVLLLARELIRQKGELQEAFDGDRVDRTYLFERLCVFLPGYEGELQEVAEYLADEREQLGGGVLIISPGSGRAMARLTEEDFYQPSPVPRETGEMVVPSPRVKPEIASFLGEALFTKDHDQQVHAHMLSRIPFSEHLSKEVLDRKTLFVTRKGRGAAAAMVHSRLPNLIAEARGVAGDFFKHFPLGEPYDGCEVFPVIATSRVRVAVPDARTQNLNHDMVEGSSAVVGVGWARSLASTLLLKAAAMVSTEMSTVAGEGLFLASANTAKYIQGHTLVVDGPDGVVVCLQGISGGITAGDYSAQWREVHAKWTLEAHFQGTMHVEWGKVQAFRVAGVELSGCSVDVIH